MTDRRRQARSILVAVAVFACALPIPAGSQERSFARFELFNECRPINLVVEGLPSAAATIDLRDEDIRTLGESRLRAARLFSDDGLRPYLYINLNVVERAFHAAVEFHKPLDDPVSGGRWPAPTWSSSSTGIARAGGANYVLQTLSRHIDRFVLEYLRVNEDACR